MAGYGTAFVEAIRTFVKEVEERLPKLGGDIKNLVTTLTATVNDLVQSFETVDNERVNTTSSGRAICQELVQIMVHSDAYMSKVDSFAWHAKRKERQKMVLEALEQVPPQSEPLKEYISQLKRSLRRAQESHKGLQDSFNDIVKRLDNVLTEFSKNLSRAESKRMGVKIGGAAVGVGLAAVATVSTAGLGGLVVLAIAGAGTAGATYHIANEYQVLADAIQALKQKVENIRSATVSIQSIISEVCTELDSVCDTMGDVEETYEKPYSLSECLEQLFEKLTEFGSTCSDCRQMLKDKKKTLNTAIDKFLV